MIKEIFFTECGTKFVLELFTVLTIQPPWFYVLSLGSCKVLISIFIKRVHIVSISNSSVICKKGSIEYLNINALRMSMID
jgi:hypothetical protein